SQNSQLDRELLVYVLPDSMDIPDVKYMYSLHETIFGSESLRRVVERYPTLQVRKAFPHLTDADTVKVTREGKRIRMPQWSRVFVMTFTNVQNVLQLQKE